MVPAVDWAPLTLRSPVEFEGRFANSIPSSIPAEEGLPPLYFKKVTNTLIGGPPSVQLCLRFLAKRSSAISTTVSGSPSWTLNPLRDPSAGGPTGIGSRCGPCLRAYPNT